MANKIERDIFVLRDASCVAQPIEYVKGTNAVPILLHVRDYDIPKGSTARVYVEWPSGKGEYDADGVTISGNDVLIQPKSTLFSEIGKCSMQVYIKNGSKTLVTFSHPVMVRKNMVPGITDPSQNHSDFLDEYISKMTEATDSANEASERANEVADKADSALEAIEQASQGTLINDETPSNVTTYSSEKIEEGLSLMDIQHSTSNDLYDTKPGGLRMVGMKGGTEQGTLSGKNLFDAFGDINISAETFNPANDTSANNVVASDGTITVNADTSLCWERGQLIHGVAGKTITVSFNLVSIGSSVNFSARILENKVEKTIMTVDKLTMHQFTYACIEDTVLLAFNTSNGAGAKISNVQVELGTEATSFEPFCGGIPAPNPSYPIPIDNTFDTVGMMQGYRSTSNGKFNTSEYHLTTRNTIPCKNGDIIKISTENVSESISVLYFLGDTYVSYNTVNKTSKLENTIPIGVDNFVFTVKSTNPITPQTVGKICLTVNGKYVGQIRECGKNLVPFKENYTNSVTDTRTWLQLALVYYFTDGTNTIRYYTTSSVRVGDYNAVVDLFKDVCKVEVKHNGATRDIILDTIVANIPKGTYTFSFYVDAYNPTTVGGINVSNIQLEKGTEATPYEPYTEHVATFFTDEPTRKGDVLFKDEASRLWTAERNVAEVVFDGSEDWSSAISSTLNKLAFSLSKNFNINRSNSYVGSGLCEYFIWNYAGDDRADTVRFTNGSGQIIWFYPSTIETIDDWKSWLAEKYESGNPCTVEYKIATPTYEILDTASQIALNSLKTFNGATHIEVNSKIQPEGCEWEFGTSQVGALSIEVANLHDSLNVSAVKGSVANNLTTTEPGFVLDARQGAEIATELASTVKKDDIIVMTRSASMAYLEAGLGVGMQISSGLSSEQYLIISASAYITGSSSLKAKVDVAELEVIDNDGIQAVKVCAKNITDTTINDTVTINVRMVLVNIA